MTTTWSHDIFNCPTCGYSTRDTYTAGTINDLCSECPECDTELIPGDERAWCNLRHTEDCGWYTADVEHIVGIVAGQLNPPQEEE